MRHRYEILASFLVVSAIVWAQSDTAKPTPESPNSPISAPPQQPAAETPASAPAVPDSTRLEVIKWEKAIYPMAAEEKKLQGQVMLALHITETGDVSDVEVISGDPILADAAVRAAKKWKFKPYVKNGHAVRVLYKAPMNFAFRDNVKDVLPPNADSTSISGTKTPGPSSPPVQESNVAEPDKLTRPQRVRVAQGVSSGMLVHKVQPIYPDDARRNQVQGTVRLQAVIDKNGLVSNLQVISGPKELVQAAIGAVQQWRFRPYKLDDKPIEVETQVIVNFQLR